MNLLKSLWRKLFPVKEEMVLIQEFWHRDEAGEMQTTAIQVYDPSLDEDKILKGEVESYFDS